MRHINRCCWIALLVFGTALRSACQSTVQVTDPAIFFSPYTWAILGSGTASEAVANEPGAYLVTTATNGNAGSGQITVNIDQSGPHLPDSSLIVRWQLDASSPTSLSIAGLSSISVPVPSGIHTLRLTYVSTDLADRWSNTGILANMLNVPPQSLRIANFSMSAGLTAQAPQTLRPKK